MIHHRIYTTVAHVLSSAVFVAVFAVFFITHPVTVSSHGSGPPYVKINGTYVESHPVTLYNTPTEITVGGDLASSSAYLVGETLEFEIDERFFPNPYRVQTNPFAAPRPAGDGDVKPEFRWDFTDGSEKVTGIKASHAFSEPKTYIVSIEVRFPGKTDEFTEVNSVQLDVVPDDEYERPIALINANGQEIVNSARDIVEIRPGAKVSFEAVPLTGNIVSYEWDFGDQSSAEGQTASHRYGRDEYFPVFPLLRVTDDKGIFYDTYAFLDTPLEQPNVLMRIYYTFADTIASLFD